MKVEQTFFDQVLDRRDTRCVKWDAMEQGTPGMLPMWVADMDFRSPVCVQEALKARAEHPTYGYTMVMPDDRTAMTDFWARQHHVQISPESVVMLPGVITGMRVAIHALTRPGDGIIIQDPVYGPFRDSVQKTGRKVMHAPLRRNADGYYTMDLNAVEEQLKQGARMMFLCNPHNPVGRAWSLEEIRELAGLLKQYGAKLVSDEIHADFVYSPRQHQSALLLGDPEIVMLTAASKTFNLAGLQQACLVCADQTQREAMIRDMEEHGTIAGNLFGLEATRAAYQGGDEWLAALKEYLKENVRTASDMLRNGLPDSVLSPMEATYLGWLDLRKWHKSTEELMKVCLDAGVQFTPGTFFGEEGEGFLRLNLACPRLLMQEGLNRLIQGMRSLGSI